MCATGDSVSVRTYGGVGHDGVVRAGWRLTERWLANRFAGKPATSVC